ncbi:WecB/TagA/CpsF family glycosyltransferase [Pseudocalidococcus azoricus]|uniref:WecB/TagA/CpsF family glycosyltransferase n=1 Tax=Pseudocalidococcus azoricus TaxID=3110322 RepID=UPI00389B29A9
MTAVDTPSTRSSQPRRVSVLGYPLDLLDNYPAWLTAHQGDGFHVVTLNAEMIMQAEKVPQLAQVIKQASFIVPDGSGVVLYLRLYGIKANRQPGIELSESLLKFAATQNPPLKVFFYGSAPGVAAQAAKNWQKRYPHLNVVGIYTGYQTQETEAELKKHIQTNQPDIIFVALGVPRQEYWIAANRHLAPQATWVGVGGSFDIWAGKKVRAPQFFLDHHLEWLYRLYQEPWRWRRMLVLPQFALRGLWHRLRVHQI